MSAPNSSAAGTSDSDAGRSGDSVKPETVPTTKSARRFRLPKRRRTDRSQILLGFLMALMIGVAVGFLTVFIVLLGGH